MLQIPIEEKINLQQEKQYIPQATLLQNGEMKSENTALTGVEFASILLAWNTASPTALSEHFADQERKHNRLQHRNATQLN